jgi:hypothetical protein
MVLMVGVVAVSVLAAGCGGDSSGEGDGSTITKGEFVKRADAICKKVNEEVSDQIGEGSSKEKGNFVELVLAAYAKEVDEIEALGVPSGDEAQVAAFVNTLNQGVKVSEDPNGFAQGGRLITKAQTQAEESGLASCPAD